jgi:uncharacterized RDD family membrane protein YckC
MAEPPRDSLAEHPLGMAAPKRRPRSGMLDLFPDIGELPLSSVPAPPAAPSVPGPAADADSPPAARAAAPRLEEADDPGAPLDVSGEPESAGVAFARRVAAGLADLLILALVGAVELAAGALLLELRFPPAALVPLGAFLFLAALVLLVLAPFVWGTTPGMALADLRIRADDGGSPTLASSFLRFVGFLLTGALAGVPLLVAAFDRKGRTLSDLLSRTTVAGAERAAGSEAG